VTPRLSGVNRRFRGEFPVFQQMPGLAVCLGRIARATTSSPGSLDFRGFQLWHATCIFVVQKPVM
jgi:hypothetical protein